ncbi:carbamoyltransferase [Streptomyces spororaveus]|uniref:Carbamoyltransferase n=1 Tax=Streptomyces spororaveus TaxID=284039 RepID=A0ABQ3T3Q7_9ACTN|nr:carbamoyltransferase N-terminal domain-containing protein [Streptomyces spororaveus]GHI75014.1 hypothetical protein Sspor_05750 [Streptomyces spororaveus]
MTAVLGLSCYFHDSAAALIIDGQVVAAAEEERFSRVKHDASFPDQAIRFCLEQGGITSRDLTAVAFYEEPATKLGRVLTSGIAGLPRSSSTLTRALGRWGREKLWIESTICRRLGVRPSRVTYVDHHLSHAASSFLASPFAEAATLTIDGVGEWSTATIGQASGAVGGTSPAQIHNQLSLDFPHSVGLLYSAMTEYLGFEVNEGEFKVMGMAAYGTPRYRDKLDQVCTVHEDGSLTLDMRYFAFHRDEKTSLTPRLFDLLGAPPRDARRPFGDEEDGLTSDEQHYADVAASIQELCEDIVVAMAQEAHRRSPSDNLAYAGGVALNGLANRALLDRTPFQNLYIPPAPGDSGGALGAALYTYHALIGQPRSYVARTADLGKDYSECIEKTLGEWGVKSHRYDSDEMVVDFVADRLAAGDVVGWHQGRFEWGPRALGHRSILADPTRVHMKATINKKVKFREQFRPFAPAVLADKAERYFSGPLEQGPARFMQFVVPAREGVAEALPAVVHFGTSRVQAVHADQSPRLASLIEAFDSRSGHPVLLNTSFNLKGEPIVASPADALSTFYRSGLDLLVMGDHVIVKG